MTLVIVIKNRKGLVFAADSAQTCVNADSGKLRPSPHKAKKIIAFDKPHNFAAAVTYGMGAIDKKNPSGYRREFEMKPPL
jgi:hypothetical protein